MKNGMEWTRGMPVASVVGAAAVPTTTNAAADVDDDDQGGCGVSEMVVVPSHEHQWPWLSIDSMLLLLVLW